MTETLRRILHRFAPGFHPLRHPWIVRWLGRWVDLRRSESLETRHGFQLFVPRGHRSPLVIDLHLFGEYEPAESRLLVDLARDARLAFDVGANVGYTSVLMARAMRHPEAEIHAFEPDPENFAVLRENLRRQEVDRVVANASALSSAPGTASLHLSTENFGDHTLAPAPDRRSIDVLLDTFDRYYDANCRPRAVDLVKIDVQGHELDVLRGMQEALREGRIRHVLFELWPARVRAQGSPSEEVCAFLSGLPYESRILSDTGDGDLETLDDICREAAAIEGDPHRFFNVLLVRRAQTST